MKLMTEEVKKRFEKQGNTEDMKAEEIKIIAKFFNPCGQGTWYCFEYDPKDKIFVAYVNLMGKEFAETGSVSLEEIESVKGPLGLGIERDKFFGFNHTLKEVMDTVQRGEHI